MGYIEDMTAHSDKFAPGEQVELPVLFLKQYNCKDPIGFIVGLVPCGAHPGWMVKTAVGEVPFGEDDLKKLKDQT